MVVALVTFPGTVDPSMGRANNGAIALRFCAASDGERNSVTKSLES
jgi:hypothetical protein